MERDDNGQWKAKIPRADLPIILERIRQGEFLKTIASDYDAHFSAITHRFRRQDKAQYLAARLEGYKLRIPDPISTGERYFASVPLPEKTAPTKKCFSPR